MEFTSKEDIDAPIAEVFAVLSEFEGFERSAIRRGIDVQRLGSIEPPVPGMGWDTGFSFRGKTRKLRVILSEYEPDTLMCLSGEGDGLAGAFEIELLALSPRRTRMSVKLSLAAKTLSARLLVQSLKLAKSKLNQRFKLRVAEFAGMTEDRLARTA